jgi:hypothetical protein
MYSEQKHRALRYVQMCEHTLLCTQWVHPQPTQPTSELSCDAASIRPCHHHMYGNGVHAAGGRRRQDCRCHTRFHSHVPQCTLHLCGQMTYLRNTLHQKAGQLQRKGNYPIPLVTRTKPGPSLTPRNHRIALQKACTMH